MLNIDFSLSPTVFTGSKRSKCTIHIQNRSQDDIVLEMTLYDGDGKTVLASTTIDELRSGGSALREVEFAVSKVKALEIEPRTLNISGLIMTREGISEEINRNFKVLILPQSPPYTAPGVPINSSFQGREHLYQALNEKYFGTNDRALYLDAPGGYGKTTFLHNLRRQPQFERVHVVVLSGGSRNPQSLYLSQPEVDFEKQIAALVFNNTKNDSYGIGSETLIDFLYEQNRELESKDRYLLIAIDDMEEYLQFYEKYEDRLVDLHRIRDTYKNSLQGQLDRIRWLFCGDLSLNFPLRQFMFEHLSKGSLESAGQLRPVDERSGRRIATVPVKDFCQYDEDALIKIGDLTGWHPYLVQSLCKKIYLLMCDQVTEPPGIVTSAIVEESASSKDVQDAVKRVWDRTLHTLKGLRLMTEILGAIKALHGNEATESEILNAIMQSSPQHSQPLSVKEARDIAQGLGLSSQNTTLPALIPGAIKYLCQMGLLLPIGGESGTPRYKLASGLFVRYIDTLPVSPRSHT